MKRQGMMPGTGFPCRKTPECDGPPRYFAGPRDPTGKTTGISVFAETWFYVGIGCTRRLGVTHRALWHVTSSFVIIGASGTQNGGIAASFGAVCQPAHHPFRGELLMNAEKPPVIVTRKLPELVEARMRELFDAQFNLTDRPMSREQLVAAVQKASVLVPTVTDRIDRSVLSQSGPDLKLIAN